MLSGSFLWYEEGGGASSELIQTTVDTDKMVGRLMRYIQVIVEFVKLYHGSTKNRITCLNSYAFLFFFVFFYCFLGGRLGL